MKNMNLCYLMVLRSIAVLISDAGIASLSQTWQIRLLHEA